MSDDERAGGVDNQSMTAAMAVSTNNNDNNEPFGPADDDGVEMTAIDMTPSAAAGAPEASATANDPFTAQVIVPTVGIDDDDVSRECGVCLSEPEPGQVAKLLCCRNFLCLFDAQRVGACPFCRKEPLSFGLE